VALNFRFETEIMQKGSKLSYNSPALHSLDILAINRNDEISGLDAATESSSATFGNLEARTNT
jgi:hypothetical protein